MSEYQCYEFVAVDQTLTEKQMSELRAVSSRAKITPRRFWNEYQWGDLKADPAKLLQRYFDAHLYFANWGSHRLMLRVPKSRIQKDALKPYFVGGHAARLTSAGEYLVLRLTSDTEEPEYDDDAEASLDVLSRLRTELMRGDMRPAYLAWLLAVGTEDVDDDAAEPDVPAGLAQLTAPQRAMVDFLRIDVDLIAAAASRSSAPTDDRDAFVRWVASLSIKSKDAWLKRAAEEPDLALGGEILREFRTTVRSDRTGKRRTVGELRKLSELRQAERERAEDAQSRRQQGAVKAARKRHLTKLARDVPGAWAKFDELLQSTAYDEALKLAVDLRDIAAMNGSPEVFTQRFDAMRKLGRRRGFFSRWKRLNQTEAGSE